MGGAACAGFDGACVHVCLVCKGLHTTPGGNRQHKGGPVPWCEALTAVHAVHVLLSQISGSAHQLLQLQQDGQLTSQSLQNALRITADAITSAVLAGKGVDSMYANELLAMTAQGLGLAAASSSSGASTVTAGRRLLAAPEGYSFTPIGGDNAAPTTKALDDLADLLQPSAGPAVGWVSSSGGGLSVSVLNRQGASYAGYTVPVGSQVTNNTEGKPIQEADLTNPANALVNVKAGLTPDPLEADNVAVWVQMVDNPAVLITAVPTPSDIDVAAYKEAAWNSTLPPVAPPLLNLTVLTPVVIVKFPRQTPDTVPCVAGNATNNQSVDCTLTIKHPISNATYMDPTRLLLCLRIGSDGKLSASTAAADQGGWQLVGNYSSGNNTLQCVTGLPGAYVLAAVDPVDTTRPVVIIPSPSPEPIANATANTTTNVTCNGTSLDANATACNGTAPASANDTQVNVTSPSPSPAAVNESSSPSPSPAAVEESPSPSPALASPSPSPQAPQQGTPQAPADSLHGLFINLGPVKSCSVSAGRCSRVFIALTQTRSSFLLLFASSWNFLPLDAMLRHCCGDNMAVKNMPARQYMLLLNACRELTSLLAQVTSAQSPLTHAAASPLLPLRWQHTRLPPLVPAPVSMPCWALH